MKKIFPYLIYAVAFPLLAIGGAFIFKDKFYSWITLAAVLLACLPFFIRFEKKETDAKTLILISVMIALSVVGRFIFSPLPGFKPVTAMTVLTAMYFGSDAGFMTGALTAVISNFYFGQGPWTPFQMFSWGIIGLLAGIFAKKLKKSKDFLSVFGALAGILYSLLMDIWTVLWADGYFNFARYLAALVSSLQFTVIYAVSNVIFLLLLSKPTGKILQRVKTKYGI